MSLIVFDSHFSFLFFSSLLLVFAASIMWWSTVIISPEGGFYGGLLAAGEDIKGLRLIESFPPPSVSISVMIVQIALFMYCTIYIDEKSIASITPVERIVSANSDDILQQLDADVLAERLKVLSAANDNMMGTKHDAATTAPVTVSRPYPVSIEKLRKVYPPVKDGGDSVVAVKDFTLSVNQGEVFGLLGANGAGKTTLLSMLTRLSIPSSGNAYIANHYSILTNFRQVASNLGVVTQNNSLWDRLTVESHLYLFARLRGVPINKLTQLVNDCLIDLELEPHRHKLSMSLSGGMKRKLCVAIALIGDPKVVLLDEPSAGLDPVSRRNLWSVILRTMSHRSVILTTHSMEEAEVLCNRLGVMVQGQLHALGGKQHLKSKFGSEFEIIVKIGGFITSLKEDNNNNTNKQQQQQKSLKDKIAVIQEFLYRLGFLSVCVVYENGGLVTFQVSKVEIQQRIGLLFTELEANKEKLSIESYSIAQPTLEQVNLLYFDFGCLFSHCIINMAFICDY